VSDCTNVTKRLDNYLIMHFRNHVVIHFYSSLYEESDPEVLLLSFDTPVYSYNKICYFLSHSVHY
jgi:hypothetical protein